MPVDYSKWDALELSDDSDIEVHPNVDKRSFIRAKQAQIHQERAHRKHRIETLKYERIINDGLLSRIDALLNALNTHLASSNAENADEIVFQSLIESADPNNDQPPQRPDGVHTKVDEPQPTFSRMMAALVDQVKKHVDETKPADRLGGYIKEVGQHKNHVLDLQQNLLKDLAGLEKLEGSKITSDSIHTGFDTSHVYKPRAATKSNPSQSSTTTSSKSVELLNSPNQSSTSTISHPNAAADSGSEADVEDVEDSEAHIEPSAVGKTFGRIKSSDYQASLQFISQHPDVLAERETDGLLIQAFDAQGAGKSEEARNCVHQALLLQYCRSLGRDGVALFFRRITTKDHQARKIFYDDVHSTYARLRDRAVEMAKENAERAQKIDEDGGIEQIQLHAVNPGQKIAISIPSASDPSEAEARKVFEAFPPGLQRALESGELDEVNKVLGKMSVEEAEEVVEQMGGSGMLSMEEGVIDATTEEGKRQMKEIEETGRMPGSLVDEVMGQGQQAQQQQHHDGVIGEPGPQEVEQID